MLPIPLIDLTAGCKYFHLHAPPSKCQYMYTWKCVRVREPCLSLRACVCLCVRVRVCTVCVRAYVFLCVCVRVCYCTCPAACTCACVSGVDTHIRECTYTCACVFVRVHMCLCVSACMCACACVRACALVRECVPCVFLRSCARVCVCVRAHMCVCASFPPLCHTFPGIRLAPQPTSNHIREMCEAMTSVLIGPRVRTQGCQHIYPLHTHKHTPHNLAGLLAGFISSDSTIQLVSLCVHRDIPTTPLGSLCVHRPCNLPPTLMGPVPSIILRLGLVISASQIIILPTWLNPLTPATQSVHFSLPGSPHTWHLFF